MNPRHAPTAAGPELPRRRDDDGSPFAREQFALRPPEEQDAMIAKWKMQQLTAEQLDLQLRERKRQRRQALRRERLAAARAAPPAASSADGAPVVRRRYGKLTPAATNAPLLAGCAPPPPPGEKRKAAQRTTRPTAKEGFAYHEYTLLDPSKQREDGALQDDVSRSLFHVVPVREERAPCPPCSGHVPEDGLYRKQRLSSPGKYSRCSSSQS